jgi:tetratricopeptide (TPR) repeat protein
MSSEETSNTVSGGTFKGPVLQGRDFTNTTFVIQQAAAAPVALAQLPPLTAGFTGREAELAQVARLLDPAAPSAAVVVSAVAGLAGVGKTALAVHAAHAALKSGWFPGGVLFIDLHGYDPSPVQPAQALDALLRALGVSGEHIPEGTEARAGLYRSALAQVTGPVLIVADNASAEAQVRPLLPGSGPHRVIVTSRHTLAGLGARLLDVTVLDQAAAIALLDQAVRAARPDDDRVSGDGAAAEKLAEVCGGLPLALQITAALLVADPVLTAAELAASMADEVHRLETLRYDDGNGVSAFSVAAAFELSYRQLDKDAARLFRLLPVDPGPDMSTEAAAALAGWPTNRVRAALGRLVRAHLVEPAGAGSRWRMHDLLRLYARKVSGAATGEQERATDRLLAWYLRHASAADAHLRALPGKPVPAEFTGRGDALAWLDAQRPNLIATVVLVAGTERDQVAVLLPPVLGQYLSQRRRFDDWLTVLAICRDTAHSRGCRGNEAVALTQLGVALRKVRRFEEAISACRDAVAIFRETGDRHLEGAALDNLAVALREVRRFEEAIGTHQDAVAILRETGDQRGEGVALTGLGVTLREVRRFEEAISACRDAVAIFRETGDRHREGAALNNLGTALQEAGRFEEAISACQSAVAIFRETSDRHEEGAALTNLGAALQEAGRFEEAISACQDAVTNRRETGDRHREGMALNNLGTALQKVGRFEEAISACRDAVAIFRETGDRHREGGALDNLGTALREAGRLEEAISACQGAVTIFRETGDRHSEGQTLDNLGSTNQEMRKPDRAAAYWREAAAAMRDAGDQEEAACLEQRAANTQTSIAFSGGALPEPI